MAATLLIGATSTAASAVGGQADPASTEAVGSQAVPMQTPASPAQVGALGGDRSVAVRWAPVVSTQDAPVAGYRVTVGGKSTRVGPDWTSFTFTGFKPLTSFDVAVAAYNSAGESAAVTTTARTTASAPERPEDVTATAGHGSVRLTWEPPTQDYGSPVTGYLITLGARTFQTDADQRSIEIGDLADDTQYGVTVRAVSDLGAGFGSHVGFVTFRSPHPPSDVRSKALVGAIELSWAEPIVDGGMPVTGYIVKVDGRTFTTTDTQYTVSDLEDGKSYDVSVQAVNAVGASTLETLRAGTLKLPNAPSWFGSVTPGVDSVSFSWSPRTRYDGADPTAYEVQVDGRTFTTSQQSLTVTGLTAGETYDISVRAINVVGMGPAATTTGRVANTPTSAQHVTFRPGIGGVDLYWAQPADTGRLSSGHTYRVEIAGRTLTGRPVYSSTPTGGVAGVSYATLHVGDLQEGVEYEARIWLVNAVGTSPVTTLTVAPYAAPGLVKDLAATAGSTDSVIVTWTPPTDGAAQYGHYEVLVKDAEGTVVATQQTAVTKATLTGLTAGNQYTVLVRSTSQAGIHSDATVDVTTRHSVPGSPWLGVQMGNRALTVRWSPTDTGSLPILGYRVTAGGRTCSTGPDARTCVLNGLADSTRYEVSVVAINAAGTSSPTTATGRTAPAGAVLGANGYLTVAVKASDFRYPKASGCYDVPISITLDNGPIAGRWTAETVATRVGRPSSVRATASGQGNGTSTAKLRMCPTAAPAGKYVARTTVTFHGPNGPERTSVEVPFTVNPPKAVARVTAVQKASKLKVDVDPNMGRGYWSFQVQQKRADGSWKPLKTYKTRGNAETSTVNLPKGRYRVVVQAKHGYAASTSAEVSLAR